MDLFQRNFPVDDEEGMDYHDSEDERRQYSSDDDICEIEEALLQRIHYAEDYQEDPPPREEGGDSLISQCTTDNFSHIKIVSLERTDAAVLEQIDNESKVSESLEVASGEGENLTKTKSLIVSIKSESKESFDDAKKSKKSKRDEKTRKKLLKSQRDAEESSATTSEINSDSERNSKYKTISKSKKESTKVSDNDTEMSIIEISSDSIDDKIILSRKLELLSKQSKDGCEVISISSTDSDVILVSNNVTQILEVSSDAEAVPPTTKRQWRKSQGIPESGAPNQEITSKKVKIKRAIDPGLRLILDTIKENASDRSSEDELADAMVIESLSEDEALNVHYTHQQVSPDNMAERSSLPDSSSGVSSRMWVRIPAVTLVSLSKTLNHNCFSPPRG